MMHHPTPGEMLLIRKPKGWTSFDVVAKLRRILKCRKIGHAGTLDPQATGLMLVCTGSRTKEISRFMGMEKEYVATIRLGGRTPSFDAETPVIEELPFTGISDQLIREVLKSFEGPQVQIPPMWSAAKVGGKPLYVYARKGKVVERKPREVVISSITPLAFRLPEVTFRVVCSKGTYVRSLADDIGRRLGCGAYLTALERTRIGEYRLDDALSLEDLQRTRVVSQTA